MYFIEVQGGQATLFASPSGQSMLIDTGWPGNNGRDADRIAAFARQAGLTKIDYLANVEGREDNGYGIRLTVHPNGSFRVTNLRTGFAQDYAARQ